jgi:hypothetical protein
MKNNQLSYPVFFPSKEMPPMFSPVRRRGLRSPGNLILAAVSTVALVAFSMPLAAQTTAAASSEQLMYACYVPLTGTVYRIKANGTPAECTKPKANSDRHQDHIQFVFNATGPMGPAGPQGPQGEVGPAGPAGAVGAVGPKGDVGPAGAQGVKGETGATGAQGPQGIGGPMGPAGPQGQMGPQGAMGPQGPQGIPGVSGWEVVELRVGVNANSTITHNVLCPAGKKPFGGGFWATDGANNWTTVLRSSPSATGWVVTLKNSNGSLLNQFNIYVTCGTVTL